MKDATIITKMGIVETANANILKEGGQYFVRNKMINREMKFPMTGKAEDKATFWYAARTAVSTLTIICTQKQAANICNVFIISGL